MDLDRRGLCGGNNALLRSCGGRTWLPAAAGRKLSVSPDDGSGLALPTPPKEEEMDFTERLDELQAQVAEARKTVQAAAADSREQLRSRVDQAQADLDRAGQDAQQKADQAASDASNKWAQMRADAAAKRDDVRAKIDKRNRELNAQDAAD